MVGVGGVEALIIWSACHSEKNNKELINLGNEKCSLLFAPNYIK